MEDGHGDTLSTEADVVVSDCNCVEIAIEASGLCTALIGLASAACRQLSSAFRHCVWLRSGFWERNRTNIYTRSSFVVCVAWTVASVLAIRTAYWRCYRATLGEDSDLCLDESPPAAVSDRLRWL